ncbi:lysis system i-spanin subunit Rz [Proteus vulgaris]|uniref:lysis system i-spanin subunit Rz n=1 Tax=Proteus vulgaris TaxID=585 RepID=UPI001C5BA3E4|nr:lysis system i-spanin subunit Rz [Proteus vulgaris]MBW3470541.1 lysis system i-spanin subunit Rz [Proteus vulgaris]
MPCSLKIARLKGDTLALKQNVNSHQDAIDRYQKELTRLSEQEHNTTQGANRMQKMILAQLNDELRNNTKRVYIQSRLPQPPIITPPPPPAMGNATPRTTYRTAQQDYLRLLEMMAENQAQTEYLIDYTNDYYNTSMS